MSIKYVIFDEEQKDPERELLSELEYLFHKLGQEGLSFEYETKVTIKKAEVIKPIPINVSKKLLIKMLHKKSNEISNYIKDAFKLDEEKVTNINGFLSEYTNENESSLDTIKSVREKNE